MTDVKDALLNRTSVRRYEREAIPEEDMEFIRQAIRNTPTSYNGQQFSVIEISDQSLKEKLYELTGQKQIKTCNRFLVFLSDFNKIALLAKKKGFDMPPITDCMDGVMLGTIDASLAMMSAVVAAQACGLGTNCIGYLRTVDPAKVAEILKLPKGTFVVCGLAIGIPREHPDLKPKQPVDTMFFNNVYEQNDAQLVDNLEKYDSVVSDYNRHRAGGTTTNDWVGHILGYYREATKYKIFDYLKNQGYNVTH